MAEIAEHLVGEVLEGKYRVEAELGRGGFSRVVKAMQVGVERPVALKIMSVDMQNLSDTERDQAYDLMVQRFQQEAKLISKLRSPHTIEAYEYGQMQDGSFFLALEFIDGSPLSDIIVREAPLEPSRVVKILRQILLSLKEAHFYGILHRDIKPNNIMLYTHMDERDLVKVLDFGVAKVLLEQADATMVQMTKQGALVGTPAYMAPELILGENVGPFTDLYAVGLVCYEMLVGRLPFEGKNNIEIIAWHMFKDTAEIPAQAGVPEGLRYIVNRMLRKDVSERYSTVKEVLADLEGRDVLSASAGTSPTQGDAEGTHAALQATHNSPHTPPLATYDAPHTPLHSGSGAHAAQAQSPFQTGSGRQAYKAITAADAPQRDTSEFSEPTRGAEARATSDGKSSSWAIVLLIGVFVAATFAVGATLFTALSEERNSSPAPIASNPDSPALLQESSTPEAEQAAVMEHNLLQPPEPALAPHAQELDNEEVFEKAALYVELSWHKSLARANQVVIENRKKDKDKERSKRPKKSGRSSRSKHEPQAPEDPVEPARPSRGDFELPPTPKVQIKTTREPPFLRKRKLVGSDEKIIEDIPE